MEPPHPQVSQFSQIVSSSVHFFFGQDLDRRNFALAFFGCVCVARCACLIHSINQINQQGKRAGGNEWFVFTARIEMDTKAEGETWQEYTFQGIDWNGRKVVVGGSRLID